MPAVAAPQLPDHHVVALGILCAYVTVAHREDTGPPGTWGDSIEAALSETSGARPLRERRAHRCSTVTRVRSFPTVYAAVVIEDARLSPSGQIQRMLIAHGRGLPVE